MAAANGDRKPNVLILGGCGFIGRNLVSFLIESDLVSHIRVVDKVPPQTAWLNAKHKNNFEDPRVEFRSANLIIPTSCQLAFAAEEIDWDYVINCACETKFGQTDPVYREGIVKLSLNCGTEAAKHNVKMFVEISSGCMASGDKGTPNLVLEDWFFSALKQSSTKKLLPTKGVDVREDVDKPHTEDDTSDPWTSVARFKLQAEQELRNIENLNLCVLRPATVYGIGDRQGIAPRLIIGAVYKHLGEMMKLLWNADLHLNTVHVLDVCRAVWFVATSDTTKGQVFNLVDEGDTTQGIISSLISDIFDINHDYYGNTLSTICKADMSSVVDEGNDKHLAPWAEACAANGVENTPLTPYMDQELLYNKHLFLDGTRLRNLGFHYAVPLIKKEGLLEILEDYAKMNLFPRSLISK